MPKTAICKYCGKEFIDKHRDGKKFCDRKCYADYRRGRHNQNYVKLGSDNPNWRGGNIKTCLYCGIEYIDADYNRNRKYCSRKCYGLHMSESHNTTIICKTCGKEFSVYNHDVGRITHCSQSCAANDPDRLKRITGKKRNISFSEDGLESLRNSAVLRDIAHSFSYCKSGYHDSDKVGRVWYRSSYELKAYKLLDRDCAVISYKPEPFGIHYMFDKKKRKYFPDILVELEDNKLVLVEIKANWQLKTAKFIAKSIAATKYASENNMKFLVWTEDVLLDEGVIEYDWKF